MKITPYDKAQALKRSKKYAADYRQYITERGDESEIFGPIHAIKISKAARKLCNRYNIMFPINPEKPFEDKELHYAEYPVSYLEHLNHWRLINTVLPLGEGNILAKGLLDLKSPPISGIEGDHQISHINHKLVLMINTKDFTRSQIMSALGQFIEPWLKDKGKGRRAKESSIDIWRAYDLQQKRNNYTQVARELFDIPEDAHPTYNTELDSRRKQVKRAYKKALEIIKAVEEYTGSPIYRF